MVVGCWLMGGGWAAAVVVAGWLRLRLRRWRWRWRWRGMAWRGERARARVWWEPAVHFTLGQIQHCCASLTPRAAIGRGGGCCHGLLLDPCRGGGYHCCLLVGHFFFVIWWAHLLPTGLVEAQP